MEKCKVDALDRPTVPIGPASSTNVAMSVLVAFTSFFVFLLLLLLHIRCWRAREVGIMVLHVMGSSSYMLDSEYRACRCNLAILQ